MRTFLIILFIIFFLSCSSTTDNKDYIARVGNTHLTKEDLSSLIPESNGIKPLNKDCLNSIVSSWIKKEVLFQKAKEYHFDKDEGLKIKVNNFFKDLTINSYVKYYLQTNVSISEQEIKDYYLKNRRCFIRDMEEAKVSHIVVQDFNETRKIKNTLLFRNHKELDKLFSKYKFETKIIRKGESLKELDKTIFETAPRHILGPIASDYGFHIIQVLSRYRKGSIRPIDEVRDEITQRLTQKKIQESYNSLVDSLILSSDYEINDDNLLNFLGIQ